ncbi:MAG: 3-isopropylmalate dehydratase small subunit [Azovibrio sp.]|nr:3-isopropylmalate dehydratase small subunit [Azovibrio sp.]
MDKFVKFDGLVAPLDRNNVDTDAIIPKQFLKSIKRSGFGPNAFDEWRYMDHGEPGMDNSQRPLNPNFVLNQQRYQGASILLTRSNFGCGSSREHAPWALGDYGFKVILAESFADIFGLTEYSPGFKLTVDLAQQQVVRPDGHVIPFQVDPFRKECLLNGWDDIGLTLRHADKIREFEDRRKQQLPWLFA